MEPNYALVLRFGVGYNFQSSLKGWQKRRLESAERSLWAFDSDPLILLWKLTTVVSEQNKQLEITAALYRCIGSSSENTKIVIYQENIMPHIHVEDVCG